MLDVWRRRAVQYTFSCIHARINAIGGPIYIDVYRNHTHSLRASLPVQCLPWLKYKRTTVLLRCTGATSITRGL